MNGLLLVDKPAGWTSHDVVAKTRNITKIRRIGHAGTLDPFATGLLILGIGTGTKQLHALTGTDKVYTADILFGITSTTFDPEGILTTREPEPAPLTQTEIEAGLEIFRGGYEQSAPLFSAKKHQGTPLYRLARRGKLDETLRPKKWVTILSLTIERYAWPVLTLRIHCGSGTYIRSLGDDLGRALGVGAYVTRLRRTQIGPYALNQAISWEPLPTRTDIERHLLATPPKAE